MTTFTREDYEMAAKAAGVCLHPEDKLSRSYGNWGCDTTCTVCNKDPSDARWHPDTDDGDALRLAAKLELTIHTHPLTMSASQFGKVAYLGGWVDRTFDDEADYRACIFRAAIAIGKAMP